MAMRARRSLAAAHAARQELSSVVDTLRHGRPPRLPTGKHGTPRTLPAVTATKDPFTTSEDDIARLKRQWARSLVRRRALERERDALLAELHATREYATMADVARTDLAALTQDLRDIVHALRGVEDIADTKALADDLDDIAFTTETRVESLKRAEDTVLVAIAAAQNQMCYKSKSDHDAYGLARKSASESKSGINGYTVCRHGRSRSFSRDDDSRSCRSGTSSTLFGDDAEAAMQALADVVDILETRLATTASAYASQTANVAKLRSPARSRALRSLQRARRTLSAAAGVGSISGGDAMELHTRSLPPSPRTEVSIPALPSTPQEPSVDMKSADPSRALFRDDANNNSESSLNSSQNDRKNPFCDDSTGNSLDAVDADINSLRTENTELRKRVECLEQAAKGGSAHAETIKQNAEMQAQLLAAKKTIGRLVQDKALPRMSAGRPCSPAEYLSHPRLGGDIRDVSAFQDGVHSEAIRRILDWRSKASCIPRVNSHDLLQTPDKGQGIDESVTMNRPECAVTPGDCADESVHVEVASSSADKAADLQDVANYAEGDSYSSAAPTPVGTSSELCIDTSKGDDREISAAVPAVATVCVPPLGDDLSNNAREGAPLAAASVPATSTPEPDDIVSNDTDTDTPRNATALSNVFASESGNGLSNDAAEEIPLGACYMPAVSTSEPSVEDLSDNTREAGLGAVALLAVSTSKQDDSSSNDSHGGSSHGAPPMPVLLGSEPCKDVAHDIDTEISFSAVPTPAVSALEPGKDESTDADGATLRGKIATTVVLVSEPDPSFPKVSDQAVPIQTAHAPTVSASKPGTYNSQVVHVETSCNTARLPSISTSGTDNDVSSYSDARAIPNAVVLSPEAGELYPAVVQDGNCLEMCVEDDSSSNKCEVQAREDKCDCGEPPENTDSVEIHPGAAAKHENLDFEKATHAMLEQSPKVARSMLSKISSAPELPTIVADSPPNSHSSELFVDRGGISTLPGSTDIPDVDEARSQPLPDDGDVLHGYGASDIASQDNISVQSLPIVLSGFQRSRSSSGAGDEVSLMSRGSFFTGTMGSQRQGLLGLLG